jgi:hypothetical protein
LDFERLAGAHWTCVTCDSRGLGDDLLVATSEQETVAIGESGETDSRHAYELTDREINPKRLRCPNCGSADLNVLDTDMPLKSES